MKKVFPCGHRGRGQHCHRCAQEAAADRKKVEERAEERADKVAWEASFAADPIDLRDLPDRALVRKARQILAAIAGGEDYTRFRGKRLSLDRGVISVPLGQRYRLLFRDGEGGLRPIACMSHETYNGSLRPGMGS
ncbi:MAG: hypothetical protein KC420_16125 [Myxococcales bacterium]|nr:hypothetical protein [Myxococcales bacterium]MCB9568950.1 hypothetical protein [Myxococcales bacterium]